VLPQLAGLAVLSANGLLLKGGSESQHTLTVLHQLLTRAITEATGGKVDGRSLVCLVQDRSAVSALLPLDDCIDLCIPRGGSGLVNFVRSHTRIPMLAHADGVTHVYWDAESGGAASLPDMIRIVLDAKTDYPAACNAMETLLVHEALLLQPGLQEDANAVDSMLAALQSNGVTLLAGPRAITHARQHPSSPFRGLQPAASLHTEYGDLRCCVELVSSAAMAVAHIHAYGSGHTESILTSQHATAEWFLKSVDSACVFHNCSTRFADGQRMGLGAEVGISTARVHARGPVGVEGLCSTKWQLRSSRSQGHTAKPFNEGSETYIHKQVDIGSKL
jgi:gamma-glutamyl phosphate reductase